MFWENSERAVRFILPKEKRRYQTFAAVLFYLNTVDCQTFDLPATKGELREFLSSWWGIEDGGIYPGAGNRIRRRFLRFLPDAEVFTYRGGESLL